MPSPRHWLLKSEPETYSFERLLREKRTNWDEVRNFQARNFLREVRPGDLALVYHSGDVKAVVGIAECVRGGYPEIDRDDGKEWVQIDIAPVRPLENPVTLARMRSAPALADFLLFRQSRLSVLPVTNAQFATILRLGAKPDAIDAKPGKKK